MFRRLRTLLPMLALLLAGAANAIELDEAKGRGLVGETIEGYLAPVEETASPEVQALVEEVNARRRAQYRRIAEQHGIGIEQVEALAAKKAIEKTAPGGWVRVNGEWRQK